MKKIYMLFILLVSIFSLAGCGITNDDDDFSLINPDIESVKERIADIEGINAIDIVTEENDPNGKLGQDGGYTGALFFTYNELGNGERPIDAATDGGGCIEIYANVEDAEERDEYLGNFDDTIFDSGSHVVLGTLVIRTSSSLTKAEQDVLENLIVVALGGTAKTDVNTETETEVEVSYEITYSNIVLHENSIGSVWADVIVEVTNTGTTDLYLSSGSIDLEDENGTLVDVLNYVSVYPQVISPGEKAYYFENTIIDDVSEIDVLNVVLHPDIEEATIEKSSFPVIDVTFRDDEYSGIEATGRVENTSDEDESMLYVVIVLFDANDKPMAVLRTIEDVNAGVKQGFTATALSISDDITASSVARYEVYAYTHQYQW